MPLAGFAVWLALLAAAGLCFPRRPRLAGRLFIALGVLSIVLRLASLGNVRTTSASSHSPATSGIARSMCSA